MCARRSAIRYAGDAATSVINARNLISGTALLFGARLVAMALGLVQMILLATKFGASSGTDAYFVASSLCFVLIGPIEGALSVAFVPLFVHTAEAEGDDAAWRVAAGLFRIGLFGAAGLAVLLFGFAPWLSGLLAPGFDATGSAQATQYIRIMSPVIVFVYAAAFVSSMEFIAGRYLLPASGMVVYALAGPLALYGFADRWGVTALASGILAGGVLRGVLLSTRLAVTRRLLGPGVPLHDPAIRQLGTMVASRLATSWFLELNLLVDRVFASLLGPGFISALAYASRAVMTTVRLFMMPMSRSLLPSVSRLAAKKQYEPMRGLLEKLVIAVAFVLVPIAAFMIGARTQLLGVVFHRGAFDQAAVDATAEALLFYALGIIPFLVTPLLTATFFALKDSATPLRIGAVCVIANAALDAILVSGLGHGGIALATSAVAAIRSILLWHYLRRRAGRLGSRVILRSLLVSVAAAGAAFWCARLLVSLPGAELSETLWFLAAYAAVGGGCYVFLQGLFNRPVTRMVPMLLRRTRT